jgi:hypothetical protein
MTELETYMAALRMNGVVSPQHAPTIRKPMIQRKMEGWGSLAMGASGSIVLAESVHSGKSIATVSRTRETSIRSIVVALMRSSQRPRAANTSGVDPQLFG